MRAIFYNNPETNEVSVQLFFPLGGTMPSGIPNIKPGEAVLLNFQPGRVEELQREQVTPWTET